MNIIILNSTPKCQATKSIYSAAKKRGHNVHVLDPAFLSPFISNVHGHDRIYDMIAGPGKRLAVKDIDVLITRFATNVKYNTAVLQHLNINMGIPSIQTAEGIKIASNKWHTHQVCSSYGIRVPKTVYSTTLKDVEYLINKVGKLPLIAKYNYGSMGSSVMILETRKTAVSTIQSLIKNKADFIIQEFIPSGGSDIRIVVVGTKVIASYLRKAGKGEWRSNLSRGGEGVPITITPEEEIMALKAASATGLEVCGVDIIRDLNGVPYLVEVNSNFGFKGSKITGVNFGQKIIQFAEYKAKTKNTTQTNNKLLHEKVYQNRIQQMQRQMHFFTQNKNILTVFEKAKGKKLSYRSTDGQKKQITVNSLTDIYNMIFETFQIK